MSLSNAILLQYFSIFKFFMNSQPMGGETGRWAAKCRARVEELSRRVEAGVEQVSRNCRGGSRGGLSEHLSAFFVVLC